jgi:hypothetical protein
VTEKPRRFRRGKSEYDTEAPHTSPTGSEDLSEEEIQRRKFAWEEGDVRTIYDPYAEAAAPRVSRSAHLVCLAVRFSPTDRDRILAAFRSTLYKRLRLENSTKCA